MSILQTTCLKTHSCCHMLSTVGSKACAQKRVSRFGYAVISPLAVSVSYLTWIKRAWSINWTKSSIS